jgi:hypothetical protein
MGVLFSLGLRRLGRVAIVVVIWLVGWDVLIHEGALFQDFAGLTSPEHGSALFAWAPVAMPFGAAATPATLVLRAIHVIAVFGLCLASDGNVGRASARPVGLKPGLHSPTG